MRKNECRICGNSQNNTPYTIKEMMYGLKDDFDYFQCSNCECLQINETPSDLEKYYPARYYSFTPFNEKKYQGINGLVKKTKFSSVIFAQTAFQKLLKKLFFKNHVLNELIISKESRILDVGSGNGAKFLYPLAKLGFLHVLGCDPFLENSIHYENGLKIKKADIFQIEGKWDIITFHHSFEHTSNPVQIMQKVSSLLAEQGTCMIRIPTVSSFAWQHYQAHWFQLDAPRHLYLHSTRSMEILAEKAGLEIVKIVYDSTYKQFEESEKYKKDIALRTPRPRGISNFIKRKIRKAKYRKKAAQLNEQKRGDQAAFFLQKIS
ncbi:MAG: class I SAM-dependent methyltransferase [Bacteroidota bacterium]